VRYGLATMCVGLGQGGSVIWENLQTAAAKDSAAKE
jgi:acetyl-CoA acyltransferase